MAATSLSAPPMLPPARLRVDRLRRPIAAFARPAAASPSSGDAKRPWWAPLFRMIPREVPLSGDRPEAEATATEGEAADAAAEGRSRLTAEKARVLRREMRATETWHDAMYHSAIASRLASPDE